MTLTPTEVTAWTARSKGVSSHPYGWGGGGGAEAIVKEVGTAGNMKSYSCVALVQAGSAAYSNTFVALSW